MDNANAINLDYRVLLKLDGASEDSSIAPRTVQACFWPKFAIWVWFG